MQSIAGSKSSLTWAVHISVVAMVVLWLIPTIGLFVSSFRTADQISTSGWWASLFPAEQNVVARAADPDEHRVADGSTFIVSGNLFDGEDMTISVWGTSSRAIDTFIAGDIADLGDGETITVQANGDYEWRGNDEQIAGRGQRVFATVTAPPEFTFANYDKMLFDESNVEGMAKAFFNTLTVTIPATIIPIVIAAFAAYALAWMDFPGRALLIACVVGLLVVPLQLALIPLLKLHLGIGIGKGYLGIWLAHTGFGLPLAIYLLRNYMVGPATRHHRECQGRQRHGLPDLRQDHPSPLVSRIGVFRDLPVPLDLERPAGREGLPDRRNRPNHGDDQPDHRSSRNARRQLGDSRHGRLHLDRRAACRLFRDAALPRSRHPGRFGEIGRRP